MAVDENVQGKTTTGGHGKTKWTWSNGHVYVLSYCLHIQINWTVNLFNYWLVMIAVVTTVSIPEHVARDENEIRRVDGRRLSPENKRIMACQFGIGINWSVTDNDVSVLFMLYRHQYKLRCWNLIHPSTRRLSSVSSVSDNTHVCVKGTVSR